MQDAEQAESDRTPDPVTRPGWRQVQDVWWQLKTALDLYSSIRGLVVPYVLAVVVGMVFEALALAAIVPLVGGGGALADAYYSALDAVGLPDTDWALICVDAALFVGRSAAQYVSALLGGLVIRREAVRLQVELFELYLGTRWDVVAARSRGEINLLLNSHTQEVATFLYRCINLVEGIVYAVGLTLVALLISPSSTALAIGLLGASVFAVGAISRRVKRYAQSVLAKSVDQANRLLEYVGASSLLRTYHVSELAVEEVRNHAEERERMAYLSQRAESLGWVLPDLLFVLTLLAVVGAASAAGTDLADAGGIIALLYRVSQYLKRFADVSSLAGSVPTMRSVHRTRREFREAQVGRPLPEIDPALPPGAVVLTDVEFTYPGAPRPAFQCPLLEIERGSFVGVVGSSGSGKSTFVQMLVGLLAPDSGSARYGESVGSRQIAYVPQAPVVLSGTIESNVRWFRRDITSEQIHGALVDAGLKPWLERTPAGLDAIVGQDGATLSGGERQRLALARALVGEPTLLVLDEATSALDTVSELAVQAAIDRRRGEMTIVAVAHRISTVVGADRILVVEGGEIVEDGSPAELLESETSRFSLLAARADPSCPVESAE